jgi:D-hexose-6-phosphate mutarotase
MTPVLATIVALTNLMGTVEIDTRGARVTSYVPIGGSEVFFASKTGTGGLPLCWPWLRPTFRGRSDMRRRENVYDH